MRYSQLFRPLTLIVAALFVNHFTPAQAGENSPQNRANQSGCFELTGLEDGRDPNYLFFWNVPDTNRLDGSILTGMAQRFVSLQPETLKTVTFKHQVTAAFLGDLAFYNSGSTNGVRISILPDDGTGNIDNNAAPMAVEIIPAGLANLYPATGNLQSELLMEAVPVDFSSHNLVLTGIWHIAVEMTSSNPDDGMLFFPISHPNLNFGIRGSVNYRTTIQNWTNGADSELWRMNGVGVPFDFLIGPLLCSGESCCVGATGNIDADQMGTVDLADLTFLIDHLFIGFDDLPCAQAANIDGDEGGIVDVADLTFLIDHLFINFPPTAMCR